MEVVAADSGFDSMLVAAVEVGAPLEIPDKIAGAEGETVAVVGVD